MIGVTLNSKVKIINRDKYISLHGEDSVSKSNVFGKFVTVKYCFENGEKFLCADDQGKEYILFSDCIAYVDVISPLTGSVASAFGSSARGYVLPKTERSKKGYWTYSAGGGSRYVSEGGDDE